MTQEYAELTRGGVIYGFLSEEAVSDTTVQHTTGSTWTNSNYDANNLFRLQRDTGDAPAGDPAVRPSAALAAWARTMHDWTPSLMGDGTVEGDWPRLVAYTGSGPRLGGELMDVQAADRPIYTPEKAGANALFVRAGQQSGDLALLDMGKRDVLMTLSAATKESAPLGKLEGQYLTRLHPSVARLASGWTSPGVAVPATPTALAARALGSTRIELVWLDNSGDEQSFSVEQLVAGAFQPVQTVPAGTTVTIVPGLLPDTSYTFRVRAVGTGGASAPSNTASATTPAVPDAPSNATAQQLPSNSVLVSWRDNSINETSFHIEKLISGVWKEIRVVAAGVTSYKFTGYAAGVKHSFRVRASNSAGYSGYSNTASTLP